MRLPLAIAAIALFATPALAQEMSCTDFIAMDLEARTAAVEAMEPLAQPQESAKSTSQDQQVTEARQEPDAVAVRIAEICERDSSMTVEDARKEAAENLQSN